MSAIHQLSNSWWKPENVLFENRLDAGHQLGKKLLEMYGAEALRGSVVLGLVRGGIVVAKGVLEELSDLDLDLDILIVRKIGLPNNKELGIGALDESGTPHFNMASVEKHNINLYSPEMKAIIEAEQRELKRRQDTYRPGRPLPPLEGRKVIVVDDSIVGGLTMIAGYEGIKTLANLNLKSVIIGVPISSKKTLDYIVANTDLILPQFCVVKLATPPPGMYWDSDHFYREIPDVADDEVIEILQHYSE